MKTEFSGSIMEARDSNATMTGDWNKTGAEQSWKDSTEVTGGIGNLQKNFGYRSGLRV